MSDSPRRRALPLTWRLVRGYTMGVVLTLSVVALFLHRSLRHSFEVEDAQLLSDNVAAVRREILKHPGDLHEAGEIITASAGQRDVEKYYGRLMDATGKVLIETPGIRDLSPPASAFPRPVPVNEPTAAVTLARSPGGVDLFLQAALVDNGPGNEPLHYQIVFDASHVGRWLAGYTRTLGLMIAVATVASAVLGWIITRRGLTPLRDITDTVHRVTAAGLDERLGTKPWPKELSALAAEFDRMLERLRISFDRLSQFTADAAHEFRTPLNNLMGATSLLLTRDRTAAEYREALEANIEEYERLNRMIERLLFLARADHVPSLVNRQQLDAAHEAHEIVDFFSALAEEKGVALHVTGAGSVSADEALLRIVLTNLVSNALRHTPRGGGITIHIAPANVAGTSISVADTGSGIAGEHLHRIFDRFYRADAARGEGSEGAGLGLALVHSILNLHGGDVTVESTQGAGTTFRLSFPGSPA